MEPPLESEIFEVPFPEYSGPTHELHDYMLSSQREMALKYKSIRRRNDDHGTSGDQGEANWQKLLQDWLPKSFRVVTKGRIINERGEASKQLDVVVLSPSFPEALAELKMYPSAAVVAAFECKNTLVAEDIAKASRHAALVKGLRIRRLRTPFDDLSGGIVFGLLAHSHSWTGGKSKPREIISHALHMSYGESMHPRMGLDLLCVADLGSWARSITITPQEREYDPRLGLHPIWFTKHVSATHLLMQPGLNDVERSHEEVISMFLTDLYHRFAWRFSEMQALANYYSDTYLTKTGGGLSSCWPWSIISQDIAQEMDKRADAPLTSSAYDHWNWNFP